VQNKTTGRVFAARDGRTHQPSTLLTVTLPSYGQVHTAPRTRSGHLQPCECGQLHGQQDPHLGVPIDPETYDYRSAALDAIFFAAGLDRLWQNLRRAAGLNLQYGGTVEMQKRLAPHAHYAMRGTLPRALLRQVAAGTYHQVWWPHFDRALYTVDKPPVWDPESLSYVDLRTREPLTDWDSALDALNDLETKPAYVMRFGRIDARGVAAGTKDAERSIRYITKYITKDIIEQADPHSSEQQAHFDRLHAELATLPCSPTCANWLLYGVQPKKARPGLVPGHCSGKVHQRRTLGFTGRRVLISRQWSGKTLADHRADNQTWLRAILAGALDDNEDQAVTAESGQYYYQLARPDDPDVPSLQVRIMRSITNRQRTRTALARARPGPSRVPATAVAEQRLHVA
jgi:replication initiator protein RepSA